MPLFCCGGTRFLLAQRLNTLNAEWCIIRWIIKVSWYIGAVEVLGDFDLAAGPHV